MLTGAIRDQILPGVPDSISTPNRGATNDTPVLDTSLNVPPSAQPSAFKPVGPAHADAGQTILYHQELRAAMWTCLDLSSQVAGGTVKIDFGSANSYFVNVGASTIALTFVAPPAVPVAQNPPPNGAGITPAPRTRTWDVELILSVQSAGKVNWPTMAWVTNGGSAPPLTGNPSNLYIVRLYFTECGGGVALGSAPSIKSGGSGPSGDEEWDLLVYYQGHAAPMVVAGAAAPVAGNAVTYTMTNAQSGDALVLTGALPAGMTSSGGGSVLTITGTAATTQAQWNAATSLVQFAATAFTPPAGRKITVTDGSGGYIAGHFVITRNH